MSTTSPRTSNPSERPRALVLFTRDLRLEDHAALARASSFGEVVPALVIDHATRARIGRSRRRADFYCAAVASLEKSLRARRASLIVRRGPLVATALKLARELGVRAVIWSAPYDADSLERSRDLQSHLEEAGFVAESVHDAPAVSPEETAAQRSSDGGIGYRALVPYIAAWKSLPRPVYDVSVEWSIVATTESEALPRPEEFGAPGAGLSPQTGPIGEAATLERYRAWLQAGALEYAVARHVPGAAQTSHLSADLSFGVISARTVLRLLDERRSDPFLLAEEMRSLEVFERALATRDFFLQLGWYFERAHDAPLQERMRDFRFARSHPALESWRAGRTGYLMVDAGMRELAATGWMHPRARMVAASFLCFDLGVDWRAGRDAWDAELLEDDPAIAAGNWQWIAGVGADLAQYPRIYNPEKQARRYDPLGTYARRWIGELAHTLELPSSRTSERARQPLLPLFDGGAYPSPVVDHELRAREFLQRYVAFVASVSAERRHP